MKYFFLIFSLIVNDNFKMSNNHYSDNELQLMSYQDLRRLSILLQLPANIKKKYMISMIQAHQKGDVCMKTAIANKVVEERKVKRLNKKQSKSFMLSSSENTQQIPTDLSVSAQHEYETRFSYVAHYSKDDIRSGISRIIKQRAEVSCRNRSILQQPRKSTRKISTVGRTEIILPRNHSLTTPVRLMPQYEREFSPSGSCETVAGLSNAKNHFQDLNNYNYQFHGEFSNGLIPTTSHELYRNEPYWRTKEVYNNSLVPILNSLLTPSSITSNSVTSSTYSPQYTSSNSVKESTSFQQDVYEDYIKNNSTMESQVFQSSVANSSSAISNNHHVINGSSCNTYSVTRGNYLYSSERANCETSLTIDEINCQICNKRETTVIKNSNEGQDFLDFYSSQNPGPHVTSQTPHTIAVRDASQCSNDYFTTENRDIPVLEAHRSFESSVISYKNTETVSDQDYSDVTEEENSPSVVGYESNYVEENTVWEESGSGLKKLIGKSRIEKEHFESGFLKIQNQKSYLYDFSNVCTNFNTETDSTDNQLICDGKVTPNIVPHFSRCRYTYGHDKYPESVTDSNKDLPSFFSTFCTNESYSRAYSVCNNSVTDTTETHSNPIMTCTYAPQFSSHMQQIQDSSSGTQIQRPWCYTYSEPHESFPVDSTTWNGYPSGMNSNVTSPQNNPDVQMVKCPTHGCHYLYSVSNSYD